MNRKIKFRAWDINNKTWLKCGEMLLGYLVAWETDNTFEVLGRGDYKVMEYTGLKDEDGKEIYEGDIIEGGYFNMLTGEFSSRKHIVKYENAQFKAELIGHTPYGDTWLQFVKGKIIGNIYENPELLEKCNGSK